MMTDPAPDPAGAGPALGARALAKQRTREKVLDAARAMFIERGYERATIRDIAAAAGMSTGAVFASFSDKNELFFEILAEHAQELRVRMEAAAADAPDLYSAFMASIEANFAFNTQRLPMIQGLLATAWIDDRSLQAQRLVVIRPIAELYDRMFKDAHQRGDIAADVDPKVVFDTTWALVLAAYRRTVMEPGVSTRTLLDDLAPQVALVLRGARG
jgi:AcrR family transcriptional regulator